jgi:putative transposase
MATTDELLDILMKDYKKPEDLIGENGLLKQLTKRLLERAMQTELTEHLGYENMLPPAKTVATPETVVIRKPSLGNLATSILLPHVTAIQHLNRSSFPKVKPALPALMTR